LKTSELRKRYLDFFKKHNHKIFASDSLVPDDPSLLFTSAGMNQFKSYFLGEKKDVTRAASCQKCLRTGDLEKVGKTAYHHTFFEMLGNFSFGDYFKKEVIELAWEFLTKDLNMKEEDLWVSVYSGDDEAFAIWQGHIGIPESKIVRLGEDHNFWPANAPSKGPNGPCGPCSEVFFDKGKEKGCGRPDCDPSCDCGRFVEVWNLVFTQFNRIGQNQLEPLPQKNIDTGMGLERMASVLQGKESNYQIDILQPAVDLTKDILKIKSIDQEIRSLVNAIVDHARAAVFAIADGIYPSNEERGYVIRKIIRKALWSASLLNYKKPFLHRLSLLFAELMSDFYPEINEKKDIAAKVIKAEEEKFIPVLKEGESYLKLEIDKLKKQNKNIIGAAKIFRLYDTYGFPLELSRDIAQKNNMKLDEEGFRTHLAQQQERSRKKSMFAQDIFKKKKFDLRERSEFLGYEKEESESNILRLFVDDEESQSIGEGQEGLVILDKTPFYPESGGQLYDKGWIRTKDGEFAVDEVFKIGEAIVHKGVVTKGKIQKNKAYTCIDKERRCALARAHTATHLLQAGLRRVLGEHVAQQGSLVDEDKFRFDFTHFQGLNPQELAKVEELVNHYILNADKVEKKNISFEEAKKEGALAFFKDKYEEEVRVVSIADYSKELCGGTHLDNTSEAGSFVIVSESSISSGVRRIEALVGKKAYLFSKKTLGEKMEQIQELKKENIALKKEKDSFAKDLIALKKKDDVLQNKESIAGIDVVVNDVAGVDSDALLHLVDSLRTTLKSTFIFLMSSADGKNTFVCSASDDILEKGYSAKKFISSFKDKLGLRGGGKENLIRGAIVQIEDRFKERVKESIKKFLGGYK